MMLTLDVRSIVQMASEMDEPRPRREDAPRCISFEVLDADLLDALVRLVKLLGQPALVPGLAPLIQQEVILRLLTGPHGPQLRRLVTAGSPSQQIAKAVAWLKQNFVQALHGDESADRAHMSPSTFRQHFRALIGVSPLQYQKQLRLQEARQLMLNENLDAGNAGGRVGYEPAAGSGCWHSQPTSNTRKVRGSWNRSTPSIDPTLAGIAMNGRGCLDFREPYG
jgi:transcriptional regulator GlxA family with amidase domain